jgi:hypothetical protein
MTRAAFLRSEARDNLKYSLKKALTKAGVVSDHDSVDGL